MASKISYIPILKWKQAEMWALQRLGEKEKSSMMPLIELVMPTVQLKKKVIVKGKKESVKKTDEEVFTEVVQKFKGKRVPQIPKEISQAWGTSPIFLDFTLLYEAQLTTKLKIDSANRIITEGIGMGLSIIPVLNLNDDAEFRKAIET
ncbi:MAG: beta family protein, partial [Thaumarchaeota archaeon]|nr:beta family protein [Nitrososphaerota archaeon]